MVNYTFVWPSANDRTAPDIARGHGLGPLPGDRAVAGRAGSRSAGSTSASAPTASTPTSPSRPPPASPARRTRSTRRSRAGCCPPPRRCTTTRSSPTRRRTSRALGKTKKVKAFPYADELKATLADAVLRPQTPYYNDVSLAIARTIHPTATSTPRTTSKKLRDAIDQALQGRGPAVMAPPSSAPATRRDHRAAAAKRESPSERARAERKLGWMLCAPAVIVMLLVTAYPIVYAVWLSLQRYDLRFPTTDGVRRALATTARCSATASGGRTSTTRSSSPSSRWRSSWCSGFAARLGDAPGDLRPRRRAGVVLVPYGIITVVAAFAWRFAFDTEHRLRRTGSSTRTGTTGSRAELVVVLRDHLDRGVEDDAVHGAAAARRLHAGARGRGRRGRGSTVPTRGSGFRKIIIPLMKPAILVAVLFRTLDAFRIFDTVLHPDPRRAGHRDRVDPRLQP